MSAVPSRRFAPASRRQAEPARRPPLRVVPDRRPFAGAAAIVVTMVFLAMLGLTVFQTRMAQQQVRIDQLEKQVDEARSKREDLLRRRAELRAPQRLGEEAERLGMVPAEAASFVEVDEDVYAAVLGASGRLQPDVDPRTDPEEAGG